ncbi:putative bifunctional inhibitor/plant lipid transfer protein/seed storage helical [Arabidopsis thaliana]|uniref:Bifunctional inhibitor/lipid-transfer protein/seed storage 2S albumin superfamily protein n=5 Tax=Arabidopsis TaxID=3701 RepID=A0A1I9LP30_ARATH|nr:Bifunctional inhibitor/lipid-transfer protein/seed storage 2S albumin superfamily protein [Arabidopsis thaliana]ANM64338.1 Bifunctional inhibitor/lipid-transfer protein/seed storage 2S albumin superfamily protein [Arabidopsis thaliana]KAG7625684.1 Bifunctional inhibitor/plant lipid transfer protein/seed storage helical domain [Arabidopsis thaliana x Arabidopsis arenosa]KAG7631691.1 Bifunctional inhibitor/plant lipid transfer protein/seed storage helical domain [Arabidopsis suecica]|eukprot:NP_001326374.1 Bifunctional inhibitor/lipid-transfer protein/seed storage 2S albumin superfamily protein [Arabidopsis thaliana]
MSKTTTHQKHISINSETNKRSRRNMVMIKTTMVSLFALAAVLLMILAPAAEAVTCSPMQLSPCATAITSSSPPSALCCAKLKEQRPCLCGYMRNPSLRRFVSTPNARKVSKSCKLPIPRC